MTVTKQYKEATRKVIVQDRESPIQTVEAAQIAKASTFAWTTPEDYNKGMSNVDMREQTVVASTLPSRNFSNIAPNTTVRDAFNRRDYDAFRPEEQVPTKVSSIIYQCMQAYKKVGVIHNIIDLMGDFGCQGVDVVHPDAAADKYYKKWFKKVKGKERSERFLNMLYRAGMVPVKRHTAKLKMKEIRKLDYIVAEPDLEVDELPKMSIREIPVKYTILNPSKLELVEPELAAFTGKYMYGIRLSKTLVKKIKGPHSAIQKKMIDSLPNDIIEAAKSKDPLYVLDPEKLRVFYYKKDDWDLAAYPLLYSILDDILMLEKMKLADLAALDGVISSVRLWNLGSLEYGIGPTQEGLNMLSSILANNVGGGGIDLVWGDELKFTESSTNLHQFLGMQKYEPVINAINTGMGIPSALAGGGGKGLTNNYISVKTLIERLQYGRNLLVDFWEEEFKIIQRAKNFAKPAKLRFDRMSLSDESAEKALLIQLLDRNVISDETILERFDEIPDIENSRVRREEKARMADVKPKKAGQWHNPQLENDLVKLFVQSGMLSPSEVGIELEERKEGESTLVQENNKIKQAAIDSKPKGISQQGRPKNSKDGAKRKKKVVRPQTRGSIFQAVGPEFIRKFTLAKQTHKAVADILTPQLLEYYARKTARALTDEEFALCEKVKFGVSLRVKLGETVDEQTVGDILQAPITIPSGISKMISSLKSKTELELGRPLNIEEVRNMECVAMALTPISE